MFLIKTWNCQINSESAGPQTLFCGEYRTDPEGQQSRFVFPTQGMCSLPRGFILQEGTEHAITVPNPLNMFMCTEQLGSLNFQPAAQSQHLSRNLKKKKKKNCHKTVTWAISDSCITVKHISFKFFEGRDFVVCFFCLPLLQGSIHAGNTNAEDLFDQCRLSALKSVVRQDCE